MVSWAVGIVSWSVAQGAGVIRLVSTSQSLGIEMLMRSEMRDHRLSSLPGPTKAHEHLSLLRKNVRSTRTWCNHACEWPPAVNAGIELRGVVSGSLGGHSRTDRTIGRLCIFLQLYACFASRA